MNRPPDRHKQPFDVTTRSGWLNQLAFELRLRGADGRTVGDAVAEVEAHLDDSGEDALTAFGQPVDYAAQLNVVEGRFRPPATSLLAGLYGIMGGVYLAAEGAWHLHLGRLAPILWGHIMAAGLAVFFVALTPLVGGALMRLRRTWPLAAWYFVAVMSSFAPSIQWRREALAVPAPVLAGIGITLCIGAWILMGRGIRTDRVVDPRGGRGGDSGTAD